MCVDPETKQNSTEEKKKRFHGSETFYLRPAETEFEPVVVLVPFRADRNTAESQLSCPASMRHAVFFLVSSTTLLLKQVVRGVEKRKGIREPGDARKGWKASESGVF